MCFQKRIAQHFLSSIALFAMSLSLLAQAPPPIPEIVHTGSRYQFLVDGKPFLMLSGQAHNSSADNPKHLEPVWNSLTAVHANTAEVPIYWNLIEPQPGQFDFHTIDDVIQGARSHGLRLDLLWFGSFKNGNMDYTPDWIKQDPQKYVRVRNYFGQPIDVISPLCKACLAADENAFSAVMAHIKSFDEAERTVIMMQVENETGIHGSDRDYSPEATRLYNSPVPSALMQYLEGHRNRLMPALAAAWSAGNHRTAGTWPELFGDLAPEAFSAYYVASYVEGVAAAGKKVYPLPMYCNNWLAGGAQARAGEWPSGGPTVHVLDIWKQAAPDINVLSPDIYSPEFLETSAAFHRPDNPLFVPETAAAPSYAAYAYAVFAEFNGIGFSPFGIDHLLENGTLTPAGKAVADTYSVLAPLLPLIEKYQYTGRLHAVVQGVDTADTIPLNDKLGAVVHFNEPPSGPGRAPYRGGGIIIELGPLDYIVAGAGFRVDFRELQGAPGNAQIQSLEEGTFHGEDWVTERVLNGDEFHVFLGRPFFPGFGPAAPSDVFRREVPRILRVRLENAVAAP